ncbi:hypothetical protein ACFLT5_04340, partial [Chloroflexota bacterium]
MSLKQSDRSEQTPDSSSIADACDEADGSKLTEARRWHGSVPNLRLTASERRWALALLDVLVLNLALLAALATRFGYRFSWRTVTEAPVYFLLLTALWFMWASFFDCYELPRSADASQSAWSTGRAALLTSLTYLAIPFYT